MDQIAMFYVEFTSSDGVKINDYARRQFARVDADRVVVRRYAFTGELRWWWAWATRQPRVVFHYGSATTSADAMVRAWLRGRGDSCLIGRLPPRRTAAELLRAIWRAVWREVRPRRTF